MNSNPFKKISSQLLPYVLLGFMLALLFGALILLSYIFVWGFIIGLVLWVCARMKLYFTKNKPKVIKAGRIIEHNRDDATF